MSHGRGLDDDFEWEVGEHLEFPARPTLLPTSVYYAFLFDAVSRLLRNEGRFTGGSSVEQEALSGGHGS